MSTRKYAIDAARPKSCEFQTIKPASAPSAGKCQSRDGSRAQPRQLVEPEPASGAQPERCAPVSAGRYAPIELYGFVPWAAVTHVSGTTIPAASQSDGV